MDKPEDELLLVAIDRLRRCPDEVADTFWPPDQSQCEETEESSCYQKSKDTSAEGSKDRGYEKAMMPMCDTPYKNDLSS